MDRANKNGLGSSINKAVTENFAGKFDPHHINLPDSLVNTTRNGEESLFESPMNFAYEKKALENAAVKFDLSELSSAEASTQNLFILDKYQNKLKQPKQNKTSTKPSLPLFNNTPIRSEELENELQVIENKIEDWKKRIVILCLILRILSFIFIILMVVLFILTCIQNEGRISLIILIAIEVLDNIVIVILTFATFHVTNSSEFNANAATKLNRCVYIVSAIHLLMFVLGFVLIYGLKGLDTKKDSSSIYQTVIVAFVLFGATKTIMLGYFIYVFKKYLLYYKEYCTKANHI